MRVITSGVTDNVTTELGVAVTAVIVYVLFNEVLSPIAPVIVSWSPIFNLLAMLYWPSVNWVGDPNVIIAEPALSTALTNAILFEPASSVCCINILPLVNTLVNVPTAVILGCKFVVTVPAVVA